MVIVSVLVGKMRYKTPGTQTPGADNSGDHGQATLRRIREKIIPYQIRSI